MFGFTYIFLNCLNKLLYFVTNQLIKYSFEPVEYYKVYVFSTTKKGNKSLFWDMWIFTAIYFKEYIRLVPTYDLLKGNTCNFTADNSTNWDQKSLHFIFNLFLYINQYEHEQFSISVFWCCCGLEGTSKISLGYWSEEGNPLKHEKQSHLGY